MYCGKYELWFTIEKNIQFAECVDLTYNLMSVVISFVRVYVLIVCISNLITPSDSSLKIIGLALYPLFAEPILKWAYKNAVESIRNTGEYLRNQLSIAKETHIHD